MKLKIRNLFVTAVVLFPLLNGSVASAFYDPVLGRWLNRDPLGEIGFQSIQNTVFGRGDDDFNLYRFVKNDGINHQDSFGLDCGGHTVSQSGNVTVKFYPNPNTSGGPCCMTIKTGKDGNSKIVLPNGSTVNIYPNTCISTCQDGGGCPPTPSCSSGIRG